MIKAIFSGGKVKSTSEDAFSLCEKSRFGERVKDKIEYSLVESIFLVSESKMEVYLNSKLISETNLLKKFRKIDKKIEIKSAVFSDLRKKGYIVKTALKFGAEFRVYDRGVRPGDDHAKWILYTTSESDNFDWHDFSAKNRVAHSTKKKLLIAIVDDESDVLYYEVSWVKA